MALTNVSSPNGQILTADKGFHLLLVVRVRIVLRAFVGSGKSGRVAGERVDPTIPQSPGNQDQSQFLLLPNCLTVHWGKIGSFPKGAFRLSVRHV